MRNSTDKRQYYWLAPGLLMALGLLVAGFGATAQTDPPPPSTPPAETADNPSEPEPEVDDSEAAPRAPEAPLETTGDLSTLEYEPSESISEDKSVAFPIDI